LQSYAQKDPLVAYKTQGFQQFEEFMQQIDGSFARRILKVTKVSAAEAARMQLQTNAAQIDAQLNSSEVEAGEAKLQRALTQAKNVSGVANQPVKRGQKVGRNDLCPCGSGKKYKNCGLLETDEHKQLMAKA
jgi:preprotein translocase subunit SecA